MMSRDASQLPSLVQQMSELKMETIPKVMNEQLEEEYLIVPSAERFAFLYSFLKTHSTKKVMVFFSTSHSIELHSVLLKLVDVECYGLHGKQRMCKRVSSFANFNESEKGILLCTELAVRGLDISFVDWIIHYDPPSEEYIDKVIGKTPCRKETKGKTLIFLIPQEIKFLHFLEEHNVKVKEFKCSEEMLTNVKPFMENLEMKFYRNKSARDAYKCYILAYFHHPLKIAFNVYDLDLQAVAASFGLLNPPKLNLGRPDIDGAPKSMKMGTQKVEARQKRFSPYARQR